jgi:mono/diheme cytochrome c family protein
MNLPSGRAVCSLLVAVSSAFLVRVSPAQTSEIPPPAKVQVDFARDIEPLFKQRCQMCHGSGQQLSGLRLDTGEAARQGGYSGPVIIPGDSAKSRLIRLVAGLDEKVVMPPAGDRLTEEQIGLLRAWIDQGAKWPASVGSGENLQARNNKSDHWAFQPIAKPTPPAVKHESAVRNPIDRFVLVRLEREGTEPSPEANRTTLIRRLSLDLTGLPPTPAEVNDFVNDDSPRAYERVVDRLLESPHFGERWAIQWLDLARYGDTDGYEKDLERPYAWRYRQWVIEALNEDKPFDQFTIEQLAGDVLPGSTVGQKIATGFQRNTLKNREGGVNREQFRYEETVDRTSTIGTVWLALTVGCAQCHDHKYDPVSQKNFYQLYAFMNNIDEVDIEAPLPGELGPYLAALPDYRRKRHELLDQYHVFELQPAWEEKMNLVAANPGKWTDWDHAFDALQKYLDGGDHIARKPRSERTEREQVLLEDHFVKNYHRVISKERWKELDWETLRKKLIALRQETPDITYAPTIADAEEARESHIHIRGGWDNLGITVEPGTPEVLPPISLDGKHPRLALADWLVSRENPLTARVTVNRIWQEYFGQGIVTTSEDFGSRSPGPSHPALLDWLASEFMDNGWSLKKIHKTIVMSATYRQSSEARPDLETRDPGNVWLARQRRLRLPAELIRDAALQVSGLLYPKIGGESVRPPAPDGIADLAYSGSAIWEESKGKDRYRRGLYTFFQRTVPYPSLVNFDMPDRSVTRCARERSNTPLQALNLLNDRVFVEAANALAIRILTASNDDLEHKLREIFRLCLTREPNAKELKHLMDYYQEQREIFATEQKSAEQVMPVPPRSVDRVEAATWVTVATVLMNLDEFITRE